MKVTTAMGEPRFPTLTTAMGEPRFPTLTTVMGEPRFPTLTTVMGEPRFPTLTTVMGESRFPTLTTVMGESRFPTLTTVMGEPRFPTLTKGMGEPRFPSATLTKVMVAVLSLPHSNADCERFFSVVRKIHTEYRQSMNSDTLTALLKCKMNVDTACHQFVVTDDMVTLAKCVTHQ